MASKNSTTTKTPIITIKNNAAITNSSHVAEYFGKQHKHVLDAIDALIVMEPSIEPNFRPNEIEAKVGFGTRKVRAFNMTRDGFTLLAMGFTGKKALGFKLQYIQQFNVMEEMLKARSFFINTPLLGGSFARVERKLEGIRWLDLWWGNGGRTTYTLTIGQWFFTHDLPRWLVPQRYARAEARAAERKTRREQLSNELVD